MYSFFTIQVAMTVNTIHTRVPERPAPEYLVKPIKGNTHVNIIPITATSIVGIRNIHTSINSLSFIFSLGMFNNIIILFFT